MIRKPSIGDINTTFTCGSMNSIEEELCGAPIVWHIAWYEDIHPAYWDNAFTCQEHYEDAKLHWEVGWEHLVLPACGMPGSFLNCNTENGRTISYCFHPFDDDKSQVSMRIVKSSV